MSKQVAEAASAPEALEERGEGEAGTKDKDPNVSQDEGGQSKKWGGGIGTRYLLLGYLLATIGLIVGMSVGLTRRSDDQPLPQPPPDDNTAGEGTGVGSLAAASASLYTSDTSDPLYWELPSFSDQVLKAYSNCDGLRADLRHAAAYLANVVIKRNAEYHYYRGYEDDMSTAAPAEMDGPMMSVEADGAAHADESRGPEPVSAPTSNGQQEESSGEDAWETNTQVEGVDEADLVKSDGTNIFAAYGDRIVHFNKVGEKLSETTMPKPYFDEDACQDYWGPQPHPVEEPELVAEVEVDADEEEETDTGGRRDWRRTKEQVQRHKKLRGDTSNSKRRRASMVYYPPCRQPRARIESLLLQDGKLLCVVSGYGQQHHSSAYEDHEERQKQQPILGDVGTTKVRVYDINSFVSVQGAVGTDDESKVAKHPQLKLIGSRDLPGSYDQKGGRLIGNKSYLVSHNYVDTWYHFQRHFDRWQVMYDGLSDEEYIETASQYAEDTVIPNYVDRLLAELQEQDSHGEGGNGGVGANDCAHIARLSMYQTGNVDDRLNHWWDSGIFNGLTQVTSIDLSLEPIKAAAAADTADSEPILQREKSVAFVPSTWGTTVYATQDMLFLATQGYDEHPQSRSGFIQSTFIIGFGLDGSEGPAKGAMVGKVPGTVLNQFSLDMHNGFLRVATTTWADWICPLLEEESGEEETTEEEEEMTKAEENGAANDAEVDIAEDVEDIEDGPDEPIPIIEEPIFCEDRRSRGPSNQITILSTDSGEIMNQVGFLGGLGKPGESIYAVRFLRDKGFVVTFRRIDPFYTLDLADPTNPQAVGELEISGFSNYIHPTEDPNVLIAVGEDADENGRVLGVQLTLFGVHDFENPELISRYNIEKSDEQWSSSEVQWDHRAFRYLSASQRVILPAEVRGYRGSSESFDGFYVFKIDKDNTDKQKRIALRHEISLAPNEEELWTRCYSPARLAARSMMFQGDAMLMKNHAIESHNLDLSEGLDLDTVLKGKDTLLWRLDMDDPATEDDTRKGECYYWWN